MIHDPKFKGLNPAIAGTGGKLWKKLISTDNKVNFDKDLLLFVWTAEFPWNVQRPYF